MTRSEKRYFKLYATRHMVSGHSNYRALFDAIAAMPVYDEAALHARFRGAAFLKRFTVIKHRLYDTILASLEAFHAEGSVDARLRRLLHQTELLFQRGLYDDATRSLRSLRNAAEQHGRTAMLLEVVEWERRLMERTNYERVREEDLERSAREVAALVADRGEMEDLWQLKSRCFMLLYREGKVRSDDRAAAVKALLAHPLLAANARPRTVRARFLYHHIHSAVAFALNDAAMCEHHLARNEALLDKHAAHFRDEPNLRLSVMSNLAYVRMRLGRYDAALADLKRFKQLPAMLPTAPSPDLGTKVFAMGGSLELTVLCRMGDFERAVAKLPAIQEGLQLHDERLSAIRRASLRFQAAWACFGAGQHEQALRWLRSLLNERGIEVHEEIYALGRMLELITLLELDKADLLRYAVRNVDRFLKSHDRRHRVEQALLRYVRVCLQARRPAERQQADLELKEALLALEHDPLEQAAFDHFDPLCYALAKAGGRSMAEVARERATTTGKVPAPKPSGSRRAA